MGLEDLHELELGLAGGDGAGNGVHVAFDGRRALEEPLVLQGTAHPPTITLTPVFSHRLAPWRRLATWHRLATWRRPACGAWGRTGGRCRAGARRQRPGTRRAARPGSRPPSGAGARR